MLLVYTKVVKRKSCKHCYESKNVHVYDTQWRKALCAQLSIKLRTRKRFVPERGSTTLCEVRVLKYDLNVIKCRYPVTITYTKGPTLLRYTVDDASVHFSYHDIFCITHSIFVNILASECMFLYLCNSI